MPVYEYACEKCGHEFERQQRITEDPVKTCPVCKAKKVRRLISRTAFVLKGGGWYSDLYSSAKPGADAGSKSEGESATPAASGASDAKSEAKPETKDTTPKPSGGKGKGKSKGKSAKAA
jgi:putative FmdB family regulatory protein